MNNLFDNIYPKQLFKCNAITLLAGNGNVFKNSKFVLLIFFLIDFFDIYYDYLEIPLFLVKKKKYSGPVTWLFLGSMPYDNR